MSKIFMQTSVVVLLFSWTNMTDAQVFNSSPAPSQTTVQPAGGAAAAPTGEVQQTGWGIPMPKITMPKITMPKIEMPKMDTVTGPFKSGFAKMSTGSKKAIDGAKEMLSFGRNQSPQTVGRAPQKKPSLWQKLTARKSEPQVPQTVGEFMSQPRLDP